MSRRTILLALLFTAAGLDPAPGQALTERTTITLPDQQMTHLVLAPDGGIVLAASHQSDVQNQMQAEGRLHTWDARTGKHLSTWPAHGSPVSTLVLARDDRFLVSAGWKGEVKMWTFPKGEHVWTGSVPANYASQIAFGPDGKPIGTLGSVRAQRKLLTLDMTGKVASERILSEVKQGTSVRISPTFELLASPNFQDVDLWDARTGKFLRYLGDHRGEVDRIIFTPDGKTLLAVSVVSLDNRYRYCSDITFWDVAKGKRLRTIASSVPRVNVAALSADGRALALAGTDEHRERHELEVLALGADDSVLRFRTTTDETRAISRLALSRDGKTLAAGWSDGKLRIWDVVPASP